MIYLCVERLRQCLLSFAGRELDALNNSYRLVVCNRPIKHMYTTLKGMHAQCGYLQVAVDDDNGLYRLGHHLRGYCPVTRICIRICMLLTFILIHSVAAQYVM